MARRLPALCGGRAATRGVRRKLGVQRRPGTTSYSYASPSSANRLRPAAAPLPTTGGKTSNKSSSSSPGGGRGCYDVVNNNGNYGGDLMAAVGMGGAGAGRRVMVVADGRGEAAGALQWALSQAVRSNDTLVLLTVVKPPPLDQQHVSDSCAKMLGTKSQQHLNALRTVCESTRPEVKVETCAVEAEERAPAVVEAARRHGASLLVLGQRRRRAAVARWLQALWRRCRGSGSGAGTTVDYCIEHAPCVALAVRRRSSGGYLVSSKHHKDFWLLA